MKLQRVRVYVQFYEYLSVKMPFLKGTSSSSNNKLTIFFSLLRFPISSSYLASSLRQFGTFQNNTIACFIPGLIVDKCFVRKIKNFLMIEERGHPKVLKLYVGFSLTVATYLRSRKMFSTFVKDYCLQGWSAN